MPTVEELRAQLRAAEQAESLRGQAEYIAVTKAATFEWRVTAVPFGFRVECRYDEESVARVVAWREAFPKHGTINFRDPTVWQGMTYILGYTKDGQPFLLGGGGSVVLKLEGGWSSFDPKPITHEQAEMFERGEVPPELMKPW